MISESCNFCCTNACFQKVAPSSFTQRLGDESRILGMRHSKSLEVFVPKSFACSSNLDSVEDASKEKRTRKSSVSTITINLSDTIQFDRVMPSLPGIGPSWQN